LKQTLLEFLFLLFYLFACTMSDLSATSIKTEASTETSPQLESTSKEIDPKYKSPVKLSDFVGLYLPAAYVNDLKLNRSHNHAMKVVSDSSAFLNVFSDHIEGSLNYDDGFWKKSTEIGQFVFNKEDPEQVIDERKNLYIRISEFNSDPMGAIRNYIFPIIFPFETSKNGPDQFQLRKDGDLVINGVTWRLNLNVWSAPEDVDVYFNGNDNIGVKVTSTDVTIIDLKRAEGDPGFDESREIKYTFKEVRD